MALWLKNKSISAVDNFSTGLHLANGTLAAGATVDIELYEHRVDLKNNSLLKALITNGTLIFTETDGGAEYSIADSQDHLIAANRFEIEPVDSTSVEAAGAVMETDTSTADMDFVIDEDNMVSDSATKVPTQQSVKAYIADQVVGGVTYLGGYNANTNTPDLDSSPSGGSKGDMYTVTADGTFFTTSVEVGDVIIAEQDSPTAEGHWTILQKNLDAASIKTSYESNADTNAFTDDDEEVLGDFAPMLHGVIPATTPIISINATTTQIDIEAFDYWIMGVKYTYAGATAVVSGFSSGDQFRMIGIDSSGIVLHTKNSFFSTADLDDTLEIGIIITTDGTNVTTVGDSYFPIHDFIHHMHFRSKFHLKTAFIEFAGSISENVTPLRLDITSGTIITPNNNLGTIASGTAIGMSGNYHVSGAYDLQAVATPFTIDDNVYDDGTDLVALSNNKFATHTVMRCSRTGTVFFSYGLEEHISLASAIDAVPHLGLFNALGSEVEALAKVIVKKGNGIQAIIDVRNQVSNVISASTSTMQTTYERSPTPEIKTDNIRGALTIQGGTGTNTDNNLEVKDNAGVETGFIQADGLARFKDYEFKSASFTAEANGKYLVKNNITITLPATLDEGNSIEIIHVDRFGSADIMPTISAAGGGDNKILIVGHFWSSEAVTSYKMSEQERVLISYTDYINSYDAVVALSGTIIPGRRVARHIASTQTSDFEALQGYYYKIGDATGPVAIVITKPQSQRTRIGTDVVLESVGTIAPDITSFDGLTMAVGEICTLRYVSGSDTWVKVSTNMSVVSGSETITIEGTTTDPSKASTVVHDSIDWRDDGKYVHITMIYRHTNNAGASAGNGDYLFSLPNGYEFDLTKHPANANVGAPTAHQLIASGLGRASSTDDAIWMLGHIIVVDANRFKITDTIRDTLGAVSPSRVHSGYFALNESVITYKAEFSFIKA